MGGEWVAVEGEIYMTEADMVLIWDPVYRAIVEEFASNNDAFLQEFAPAWTKMMNADRFDGPVNNVCDDPSLQVSIHAAPIAAAMIEPDKLITYTICGVLAILLFVVFIYCMYQRDM